MNYIEKYEKKTPTSKKLYLKQLNVMPSGVSHNIRYFPPYPLFIEKSCGSKVYDVDGNEYIDLWMGHYSNILGHNPPVVKEAVKKLYDIGIHTGCVNPYELKLANKIIKLVPSVEMVKFCCSGTEATTYAIRLARAYTKKEVVLKIAGGWHGAGSELTKAIKFPYNNKMSSGIPDDLLKKTDYIFFNDIEKSYEVIKKYKNNLACIIIEPVIGEGGFLPANTDYLQFLRDITSELNTVLIFDEIITGFRISPGGAQYKYKIYPDLTTMGKIAGGGFNIGIIGGKKEILELSSPTYKENNKVLIGGGTFSETFYSSIAGYNVLDYLDNNREIYEELNKKGEYIRNKLKIFIDKNKIKAIVTGIGSLYMVHFPYKDIVVTSPQDIGANTDIFKRDYEFKVRMLNEGIYVMHGGGAISVSHTYEDLDKIIERTEKVLIEMDLQK